MHSIVRPRLKWLLLVDCFSSLRIPDVRLPLSMGGSAVFGAGGRFLSRDQKKGTEKCSHLWVTYPVVSHTPQPRDMVRQDRRGTSGSDGNDGGHPLLR